MSDLSKKSCVVVDHGPFQEVALRLARDFGKVYYVCPQWEEAFTRIDEAVIGDGYEEIIRVPEVWDVIDNVDAVVFSDTGHSGMQLAIQDKWGLPVWGARRADKLELNKLNFRRIQAKLGLPIPEYDTIKGLTKLREFCMDPKNADRWVKMAIQYRGSEETGHHENYDGSRQMLARFEQHFGRLADSIVFLAEKPIDSKLEPGIDTYTVDGEHPEVCVLGWESKDKCYFARVMKYADVPKEVTGCAEFLWPLLKQHGSRQMVSTEVKAKAKGGSVLLEPTLRFPSPAGEEQMELYRNFSDIIFEGAQGRLLEPDVSEEYACEAMIEHNDDEEHWRWLQVPKDVRRWVKLYANVQDGDWIGLAPGNTCIGAVVGIGKSPQAAVDQLMAVTEELKGQPIHIHTEAIAGVLAEIDFAETKGIEFSDKPLPEPQEVLQT